METGRSQHVVLAQIVSQATRKFFQDECFMLASSIAFYFLLSIIPFAALAIIFFDVTAKITGTLIIPATPPNDLLVWGITTVLPFVSEEWVRTYVVHPASVRSFTITGILFLPVISSLLFNILERAYRRIFELPPSHILIRRMVYPVLTLMLILFLFILNFAANIISAVTAKIIHLSSLPHWLHNLYVIFFAGPGAVHLHLIAPLVFVLFFMGTSKILLHIKIGFVNRLLAGLLFYLMWLGAKFLFGLYVAGASGFTTLYGSMSSLVMLLLWIYYSAATLLLSVELLYQFYLHNHPHPDMGNTDTSD